METENKKKHIVIIGGAFAGINVIKALDKNKYDITLNEISSGNSSITEAEYPY